MRFPVWFLLLFWVSSIHSQVIFTVAEWNVENLFDCIHDEGKEDQLFLAGDGKYWSKGRLWKKETNLAKTIASMARNSFPDVVALIEVENHHVMDHLTRRSPLRKMGYHYVMTESDDARGIDVALMYLPSSTLFSCFTTQKSFLATLMELPSKPETSFTLPAACSQVTRSTYLFVIFQANCVVRRRNKTVATRL